MSMLDTGMVKIRHGDKIIEQQFASDAKLADALQFAKTLWNLAGDLDIVYKGKKMNPELSFKQVEGDHIELEFGHGTPILSKVINESVSVSASANTERVSVVVKPAVKEAHMKSPQKKLDTKPAKKKR